MSERLFPISQEFFNNKILPLIKERLSAAGKPANISHYNVFCAMLYVLRTGVPWRDLPSIYGSWHTIYMRCKRGADKGLWWHILMTLQQTKQLTMDVVMSDSTSIPLHRHGGGLKGGSKVRAEVLEV